MGRRQGCRRLCAGTCLQAATAALRLSGRRRPTVRQRRSGGFGTRTRAHSNR